MIRRPSLLALGLAALAAIAGVADLSLKAASSPPPTVSITRLTALNVSAWPGDFNGDGITDLVGTAADIHGDLGGVAVALGKGDGTFNTPFVTGSGLTDRVLAVGDFNKDGKLDVVTHDSGTGLEVLAGTGDGNFNTGYPVFTSVSDLTNALVADVNGDGNLDIVAVTDGTAYIFPGHGDFTFGTPATLTTGLLPLDGAIADLNADGRLDIVLANSEGHSISIFLNHGGLMFTAADLPLDMTANDVVARDLNGDGKVDLVVAMAARQTASPDTYSQGFAYVLFGHGDGTFAQPIKYPTAPGAWQIVLGDFTRDGIVDIATANRSSIYRDDCAGGLKTWDSVSIVPGNGDGTFGMASSFSLGDQRQLTNHRYKNTVVSLNTSDLNGDHATDLIASWGAVLINKPADPNWSPTVTASSTQPVPGDHSVVISAVANDSDQDMLLYSWTDSGGSPIPPIPRYCFTPITFGVHTFTVTVDDQHGHTASSSVTVDFGSESGTPPSVVITAPTGGEVVPAGTPYTIHWTTAAGSAPIDFIDVEFSTDDGAHYRFVPGCSNLPGSATSCVWNDPDPPTESARIFILAQVNTGPSGTATTDPFSIRSGSGGGGGGLPSGWSQDDIGAVGAAGSATYNDGTFTVKGSGADIWGTADAFHYVFVTHAHSDEPNFEITAQVTAVQNVNRWTKAGLMIRASDRPDSAHASIFVTPTAEKGLVFQRRRTDGSTSVSTASIPATAPVWLKLIFLGRNVRAYYRTGTTMAWTLVGSDDIAFPSDTPVEAGLAVTSHVDGTLATANFSNVSVRDEDVWLDQDIGNVGITGSGFDDGGSFGLSAGALFTVKGSGADIWGSADAFHFHYAQLGHHYIAARVLSVDNTNAWAKAGVMIREDLSPGSRHVMVVVTPGKGVAMQYRATANGASAMAASVAGVAPKWVRLRRPDDSTVIGEISDDGLSWRALGRVTLPMRTLSIGGLAVTSHDNATLATGKFDEVVTNAP
jgi:VCBS repeat protein/Big-like domain-containing protein